MEYVIFYIHKTNENIKKTLKTDTAPYRALDVVLETPSSTGGGDGIFFS